MLIRVERVPQPPSAVPLPSPPPFRPCAKPAGPLPCNRTTTHPLRPNHAWGKTPFLHSARRWSGSVRRTHRALDRRRRGARAAGNIPPEPAEPSRAHLGPNDLPGAVPGPSTPGDSRDGSGNGLFGRPHPDRDTGERQRRSIHASGLQRARSSPDGSTVAQNRRTNRGIMLTSLCRE